MGVCGLAAQQGVGPNGNAMGRLEAVSETSRALPSSPYGGASDAAGAAEASSLCS